MDEIPCVHCGKFFIPRNRNQNYCTEADCQRARKAAWQRYKMKTDVDYRAQQQLSNEKWVNKTPGYWTRYRQQNPDKAERNIPIKRKEIGHFSISVTAAIGNLIKTPPFL